MKLEFSSLEIYSNHIYDTVNKKDSKRNKNYIWHILYYWWWKILY